MSITHIEFCIIDPWYVVALELEYQISQLYPAETTIVSNGYIPIHVCLERSVDCIFYDPGMNVYRSNSILQTFHASHIPLIVTTAYASLFRGLSTFETIPLLVKPYTTLDLKTALGSVLPYTLISDETVYK